MHLNSPRPQHPTPSCKAALRHARRCSQEAAELAEGLTRRIMVAGRGATSESSRERKVLYTSHAWQRRLQGWDRVNKRVQLHRRTSAGVAGSGVCSRGRGRSAADGTKQSQQRKMRADCHRVHRGVTEATCELDRNPSPGAAAKQMRNCLAAAQEVTQAPHAGKSAGWGAALQAQRSRTEQQPEATRRLGRRPVSWRLRPSPCATAAAGRRRTCRLLHSVWGLQDPDPALKLWGGALSTKDGTAQAAAACSRAPSSPGQRCGTICAIRASRAEG